MKKTIFIIVGIVVLALVLGGAAYVGGQLLNTTTAPKGGGNQVINLGGPDGDKRTISLDIIPAKELPQTPPEVQGIYVRRADNSIFVGTGDIKMMMTKNPDGTVSGSSDHSGPEVEVVLTHDTTVYRDITQKALDQMPSGDQKIQQVVELGAIDEADENSELTVWGEQNGGRVVARVLVYSLPRFMKAKGPVAQ